VLFLDLFNFWTFVTVAVVLHFWLENKKMEKNKKNEELEKRINELEKKISEEKKDL
jgi:hypothetical protein